MPNKRRTWKPQPQPIDARITIPDSRLAQLESKEVQMLQDPSIVNGCVRKTILAILAAKDMVLDPANVEQHYPHFEYTLEKHPDGITVCVRNAPMVNFRKGELLALRRAHLAAALRQLLFERQHASEASTSMGRTRLVKRLLQEGQALEPTETTINGQRQEMGRVFAWGSHKPGPTDYRYAHETCEETGHNFMLVVTGGGPGIMRAGNKGNDVGLKAQQQEGVGGFGFTCPEIIAASEPLNRYVRRPVVFPNTETRIEAFLRASNGGYIFPGGVGTLEEYTLLLGTRLHESNAGIPFPIVVTAPGSSRSFVEALEEFTERTMGTKAQSHITTIVDDPGDAADMMEREVEAVHGYRQERGQSMLWNEEMVIPPEYQEPFSTTHETVATLPLHTNQAPYLLANAFRQLFQSIVRGTIVQSYIEEVKRRGPYRLHGEPRVTQAVDRLLRSLVKQKRIGGNFFRRPCYVIE